MPGLQTMQLLISETRFSIKTILHQLIRLEKVGGYGPQITLVAEVPFTIVHSWKIVRIVHQRLAEVYIQTPV